MLVTLEDSPIFDGIWHSRNGDAHVIPEVWVVCPKCSGEGTTGNPAFDGMSLSELDDCDRDDFMDGYMSGRYDVACSRCKGRSTVRGYDLSQLTPALLDEYWADAREMEEQRVADWRTQQAEMGIRAW